MATVRQENAVHKLVENGGNVSKTMREVGYSPETAKTPSKLTDSKGFKDTLKKYGLTESLVTRALVADIKAKPKRRIAELTLGAEVLGMKKRVEEDKPVVPHTTNIVIITPQQQ